MVQIDVLGDGNCMLHSIALAYLLQAYKCDAEFHQRLSKLFGNEIPNEINFKEHIRNVNETSSGFFCTVTENLEWKQLIHQFRLRLVDYIVDNKNIFEQFFPKDNESLQIEQFENARSFEEYIYKIRKENTWMNEFAIRAASNFLEYPIFVFKDKDYRRAYNRERPENSLKLIFINDCHYNFEEDENVFIKSVCSYTVENSGTTVSSDDESDDSNSSSEDEAANIANYFISAVYKNDSEEVRSILSKNELIISKLVNFKDRNAKGSTPLLTMIKNRIKGVGDKQENKRIIEILIKNGADTKIENDKRETAIGLVKKRLKKHPEESEWISLSALLERPQSSPFETLTANVEKINIRNDNIIKAQTSSHTLQTSVIQKSQHSDLKFASDHRTTFKRSLDDSLNDDSKRPKAIPETYSVSGLKTSLHGTIYQLQLLMLFAYRGVSNYAYFDLATEMDQADKFDDVVCRYKQLKKDQWSWRFLQAKHKLDPERNKIGVKDLTTETDGPFSIQKYFISFCRIKNNSIFVGSNFDEFTLCTNTDFNFEENQKRKVDGTPTADAQKYNELVKQWKDMLELESFENDPILSFKGVKAKKYKFSDSARLELGALIKSVFLEKCFAFETIKDKKLILEKLNAIKIISEKHVIDKMNEVFRELKQFVDSPKSNKGLIETALKNVLKLQSNMLGDSRCATFKNVIDKFTALKVTDKSFSSEKQKVYNAVKDLLIEIDETIQRAQEKITATDDVTTSEFKELANELSEFNLLKQDCIALRPDIWKFDKLDNLKSKLDTFCESHNVTLLSAKQKQELDLEEMKFKISAKLDAEISQVVMLELTLNSKIFELYLGEYLEKFRFVTCYPDVDKLNLRIKGELGQKFSFINADLITDSFQKDLLDWFKEYNMGRSGYLSADKGNKFFDWINTKIAAVMTSGLNKAYPEKLRGYNISFKNDDVFLSNFLKSKGQFLCITSNSTRLTAIKVLQTLNRSAMYQEQDSFVFLRFKSLKGSEIKKLVLNSFSSDKNYHLLIIECQFHTPVSIPEGLIEQILSVLSRNELKKLILIAKEDDKLIEGFQDFNICDIETIGDETTFKDLTSESQKKLLEKQIVFQGKMVCLNRLIGTRCADGVVDETNLQTLIEEDVIEIGNEQVFSSVGYFPQYYIPRYLHHQVINPEVFKIKNTLFLFANGTRENLLQLGTASSSIYIWDEEEIYHSGIILSPLTDNELVFRQLCKSHPEKSVCWFEYREGALFWKRSFGDFTKIQEHITNDLITISDDFFIEDNFMGALSQKLVIVANDPGVGKSTFLTSLARKMKETCPELWIARINLNDHAFDHLLHEFDTRKYTKSLKSINDSMSLTEAIEYVSEMVIPRNPNIPHANFQRQIFKLGLMDPAGPKIRILFDGFDEISPTYKTKVMTLLGQLNKTTVIQICLTTRIHEKEDLEVKFGVPACVLSPLTDEQQISFLDRFWRQTLQSELDEVIQTQNDYRLPSQVTENLNEISKNMLHDNIIDYHQSLEEILDHLDFRNFAQILVNDWKYSIRDSRKAFTNVPLQLKMLAEIVYSRKFLLPQSIGLLDLYVQFIEMKFEIFYKGKNILSGNVPSDEVQEDHSKDLYQKHLSVAWNIFFPDIEIPGLRAHQSPKDIVKLARVGLLVFVSGSRLEFVHRSFAEYFLSKFLLKEVYREEVQRVLFIYIFGEDDYSLTSNFFNELLGNSVSLNVKLTKVAIDLIQEVVLDRRGNDIFIHQLALSGHTRTISFLIEVLKQHPNLLEIILFKTGKYGKSVLYDIIYNPVRKHDFSKVKGTVGTFLKALDRHNDILKKLLTHRFEELLVFLGDGNAHITILQISFLARNTEDIFIMFINSVKYNTQLFKEILFLNGPDDKGTLLHFGVEYVCHKLQLLLDLLSPSKFNPDEAYLNMLEQLLLAEDSEGQTALHCLAYRGKSDSLSIVLHWIQQHALIILLPLICLKDKQKITALEMAVYMERHQVINVFLDFLKNISDDALRQVAFENFHENSILFKAIIEGRSGAMRTLLEWCRDKYEQDTNCISLKNLLLEQHKVDGRTSLSLAAARNFSDTIDSLLKWLQDYSSYAFLIELLQISDRQGRTALHEAVYWRCKKATRVLIRFLTNNFNCDTLVTILLARDNWGYVTMDYEADEEMKAMLNEGHQIIIATLKSLSHISSVLELNVVFSQYQLDNLEYYIGKHTDGDDKELLLKTIVNIRLLKNFDSRPVQTEIVRHIAGTLPPGHNPQSADTREVVEEVSGLPVPVARNNQGLFGGAVLRLKGGASIGGDENIFQLKDGFSIQISDFN